MIPEDIGVVVIGRNEGSRLVRCLNSLSSNVDAIVYVDSGSTDASIDVARESGAHIVELDTNLPFTAGRARNAGFKALRTLDPNLKFIQFVDGDCEIASGWLEAADQFMNGEQSAAVVCGAIRERHPKASIYNQLCAEEWKTPIGQVLLCGGNSFMRAQAFDAVEGFHPDLIGGEEPELCVRLRQRGWKIWRIEGEMATHDAAMTRFHEWWTRSIRAGYSFAQVSRLHRHSPYGIWKRETLRALLWGGVIPALIGIGTIANSAALFATAVYPIQILQIATRRDPTTWQSWIYGTFSTIGKFAEFQGILKFHANLWRGKTSELIEYKASKL